jgi:arabinose-5-phosphate isomerase
MSTEVDGDASLDMAAIFGEQRRLIDHFFDHFDASQASKFVHEIVECAGTVFFSGVGKSGFICHKIAMSLASIGVKSAYLNPLDALHGDIGNCGKSDVLVLFSKSGSTAELLAMVPGARSKNMKIISVTCHECSALANKSDMNIYLPLQRELCAFDLAPVTSTILQLIFGDTVTAAVMRKLKLTLESYALNHPAGSIGRKLLLTVRDVMRTGSDLSRVSIHSTVHAAVLELMRSGSGCVVVTEGVFLKGVFTDGDLRRLVADDRFDIRGAVENYASKNPLYIQDENMKLVDAEQLFRSGPKSVSCLPVVRTRVEGIEVLGMLVLADTRRALA